MRSCPLPGSCWLPTVALACLTAAAAGAEPDPAASRIGKKIDNLSFTGPAGKPFALYDLRGKKAVVVVFLSFDCPVSRDYAVTLTEMAKGYEGRGVAFVGVCPTRDGAAAVARQAREYQAGFPVFRDDKLTAADAFRARATPEAFVLDRQFILRYRGRVDDGYAGRWKKKARVARHDLREALDEVLAGQAVREPVTVAVGCPVRRDGGPVAGAGKVTFHRDVLPILQKRCQGCHRPGEIGPFALMTYRQAADWAADIKEYTRTRRMPPWKPTEGPAFRDERKLTDREIATLAAWADGGTPEGDPKDAPPPARFPQGWRLGKPDLVLTPDRDFLVGPRGGDLFRCFVVPTNLTEDKFVVAYEVRPGNPRVLHHTVHFIDTDRTARRLERWEQERVRREGGPDLGPGYFSVMGPGFLPQGDIAGWAPGLEPYFLPDGVAYYLPKGSDFVFQAHYHRNGRPEKDRTSIGLYFAKKPVDKPMQQLAVPGRFTSIPAGAADYPVRGDVWLAQDCTLYSVLPHMHLLGKKIKVTMTPPGGPPTTLVGIDDWDYDWQEMYFFKDPIRAKAGTRFTVEAVFDNSAANPRNPRDPPARVFLGEQTTNEMCFGFIGLTTDEPGPVGFRFSPNGFVLRLPRAGSWPSRPQPPAARPAGKASEAPAAKPPEAPAAGPKEFALADTAGRKHTAAEWKDQKAVVLFFLGTECPVSNGYAPEMARLAKEYGPRGVLFWGVHPDPDVTAAAAARHAKEYRLGFTVLLDPGQTLASRTGVRVTPEVVVLSAAGQVLYRGRIDDRYSADGKRREEPSRKDLEEALRAVLAGKEPAAREAKAYGCPLPPARRPD
jgi:peroxiredoxin